MKSPAVQDFVRGLRIGTGILAALAIGWAGASFAAATWGALPTVSSGSALSASAWNDMVWQVNGLAEKIQPTGEGLTFASWAMVNLVDHQINAGNYSGDHNADGVPDAEGGIFRLTYSWASATMTLLEYDDPYVLSGRQTRFPEDADSVLSFYRWRIGIGTTLPNSQLQVVGNYVQIPNYSGSAPLATDCDQLAEAGRMAIYTPNTGTPATSYLYICPQGGGWVVK